MTGFATAIWVYSNSGQVMSASLLAICGAVLLSCYILGCLHLCMQKMSSGNNIITFLVGRQNGSGMGLIFVLAGLTGIVILTILKGNPAIKQLDQEF